DPLEVGEAILDLAREDVLPPGNDHLVVAAVDEEAAVLVDVAEGPAGEQAVDRLFVAAAGVALHPHLVADEDPPHIAVRDLLALVIEKLDHGAARRPPGGAGGGTQVAR